MRYVPALVLLLACAGSGDDPTDSGVSGLTAALVSTSPAETARSDQDILMVVLTPSEGADDIAYRYIWFSDSGRTEPEGQLQASATQKGEVWTVTVTPESGSLTGPSASATVAITNGPPAIASAAFDPSVPVPGQDLVCNPVGAVDPDGDPMTYAYVWHKDGSPLPEITNTLSASEITAGATYQCAITANDGALDGNTVTVTETAGGVGNTPPTVASAAITPTSPVSTEDLLCTPTGGADDDGDTVTFVYEWTVNGTAVSETSDTLPASNYVGADVVICTAVPFDGVSYGTGAASSAVTIGNGTPVISQVLISPGAPFAEDTIACTPTGSDPDNDSLTWAYEWTINGSVNAETSNFLAPGTAVYGDVVACTATASDASESASLTSSSVTVGNSPATVTGVAISPNPTDGQSALTCSYVGTADPDGQTVTVSYAWTVDGTAAGTGATLAASSGTSGQVAVCTVTPNDTVADGTPATASLTFDNAPPAQPTVAITPTTATSETALACDATPATDYDGDSVSYTYAWYIGTTQIGTGASLTSGLAFRADVVRCEATPNDGTVDGTVGTATITIGNTLPTAAAPTLAPTPAYEATTLTCTSGTLDDVDGDTTTPVYRWTVAGTTVSGTASTLTGTSFNKDQAVQCHVTPDDTFGQGTEVSSNSVTIQNTAPGQPGIELTPASTTELSEPLFCDVTTAATDVDPADASNLAYTVTWALDGAPYSGATATTTHAGDTIPSSSTTMGTWTCSVEATDLDSAGSGFITSGTATVQRGAAAPASIALEAPVGCPVITTTFVSAKALLEARGHIVTIVDGSQIDTLAKINAFDVVVFPSWCPTPSGSDFATFDAVIEEYVVGGGGVVASGWDLYSSSTIGPELLAVLPTDAGSNYLSGAQTVTPLAGHPISDGAAPFSYQAPYLPYGLGTKNGATTIAQAGAANVGAAWTYGAGRATFVGMLFVADPAQYANSELLLDGSNPNAIDFFIRTVEWTGNAVTTGFQTDWILQDGTIGQYTRCESVTDNGTTCINPEIRYGDVEGGVPSDHSGNNYDTWCQQLGFSSWSGAVTYTSRACPAPGGKLYGCTHSDETTWHWCDWSDSSWYNQSLDYPTCDTGTQIGSITCTP